MYHHYHNYWIELNFDLVVYSKDEIDGDNYDDIVALKADNNDQWL